MLPYILNSNILLPQDEFSIATSDWFKFIYPLFGNLYLTNQKYIQYKVEKIFIYSSIELRYLCKPLDDKFHDSFTLGHILEDLYTVKFSNDTYPVSAMVKLKLENISNIKPYSTNPCVYTLDDIDKIKSNLDKLDLKVENDYITI